MNDKAVLIIDMPENCEECPLEECDEDYYGYESNWRCPMFYKGYTRENREKARLDDCPLKELPDRRVMSQCLTKDYAEGWNDFRKRLIGDGEE